MKAQIMAADAEIAARVLSDVSQQTLDEFEAAGMGPAQLVQRAIEKKMPMFVSVADETPLTLFGFVDYGGYVSMWTVATRAFFDLGAPGVFCTRRFFRGLDLGKPVMVVTTSPHRDTDRWLGLLGFKFVRGTPLRREFRLDATC